MSPHVQLIPGTESVHQDTLLGCEKQQQQQKTPKYPPIRDWPSDLRPVQMSGTLCVHGKGIDRKDAQEPPRVERKSLPL